MKTLKYVNRVSRHGSADAEHRTMTGEADYRFGAFQLSVRRQLLVYAGAPVRVGTRALAILTALVQGEGDLVTKDKLIAAAWPSTFVGDGNLKVNVASLRRTLASHDPRQDFIATVQGRGYRFIAPVTRTSGLLEQRTLLLLDSYKHLPATVADVIDLLSTNIESVRILATRREPRRIRDHISMEKLFDE